MTCCHHFAGAILCDLAPDLYPITAGGKRWLFVLPFGCGLIVVNRHGDQARDPPARNPFWAAVDLWVEQGKRMGVPGRECVWVHKPAPRVKHLGGRNYLALDRVEWSAADERYVVTLVGD